MTNTVSPGPQTLAGIFADIIAEAQRAVAKHGPQSHPNGTSAEWERLANVSRQWCDKAAEKGELTWAHILREEFYEALAEEGDEKLRAELVQTATMAVMWILDLDNRAAHQKVDQAAKDLDGVATRRPNAISGIVFTENPANPPVRPYVPGGGIPAAYRVTR